jgi:BirA family biotin operon repressor/biotin-[acetyl-CoA-carboxylase] ligase
LGLNDHGIKWPNDILLSGAKLGGILVEMESRHESECDAIIGIGINVCLGRSDGARIEQPWTDLSSVLGNGQVDRNRLIGLIVDELLERFDLGVGGFKAFLADNWPLWDLLANQGVRVERGEGMVEGTARGISADGSLRVCLATTDGDPGARKTVEFHSGEVSIRRA